MAEMREQPMSVGDGLRAAARRLQKSGSPALDARILVQHALGLDDVSLILAEKRPLTPDEIGLIDTLIDRRARHEPIAYITGAREFWSLEFVLRPGVLVPRTDSERLIEAAIARRDKDAPLRILDLGTGSGCLLCALLVEFPNAQGVGVDRAPQAIANARENAEALGLADRAEFIIAHWADALSASFDIIISNPPYIPEGERGRLPPDIRDYEAATALFAGETGVDAYREILADAPRLVADDALVILEIGDGQSQRLVELARRAFAGGDIAVEPDLSGAPRALTIDLA